MFCDGDLQILSLSLTQHVGYKFAILYFYCPIKTYNCEPDTLTKITEL